MERLPGYDDWKLRSPYDEEKENWKTCSECGESEEDVSISYIKELDEWLCDECSKKEEK